MKLIGLMPVRNEDWVLGLSARVALKWCDSLAILDHASEDGTHEIVEALSVEYPGRIISIRNENTEWREMQHRQTLLDAARAANATHIAMIDADEIVTANVVDRMRQMVERMPKGYILQLPGYNLRGHMRRYHANGIWGNRWFSVAFANDPRLCWKGDRFHHREPMGPSLTHWRPLGHGAGGIMHLWGLSERRLIAKHALYKMVETLRWPAKSKESIDRMYSMSVDPCANRQFEQNWRYDIAPESWWNFGDLLIHLQESAKPWQEKMCRDLYTQHGAARFKGLNLFGVCEAKEAVA